MQAVHLLSLLVEHIGERPVFLQGSTGDERLRGICTIGQASHQSSDSPITHSAIMMELGAAWSRSRVSGRRVAPRRSARRPPRRPVPAPLSSRPRDGTWQAPICGPVAVVALYRDERNSNRAMVSAARLIETKEHHLAIEQMYHKTG